MVNNNRVLKFNILYILLPLFFIDLKQYSIVSIYIIIVTFKIIIINRKLICEKLKKSICEFREIKNLKYYYFLDERKIADKQSRIKLLLSITDNYTLPFYYISVINVIAICYLLNQIYGSNVCIEYLFTSIMTILGFIVILQQTLNFVFKHTAAAYLLVPLVSLLIYSFHHYMIAYSSTIIEILHFIFIVTMLYGIFVMICPADVLRQIDAKTIVITVLTTLILTLLSYWLTEYLNWYLNNGDYFLTIDKVENFDDINIKKFFTDNQEFIEITNYFIKKELFNTLDSYVSFFSSLVAISYSIGAMFILLNITNKKRKANLIYREMLINSTINYENIIKCIYLGGQEYENHFLNNDKARDIILEKEKNYFLSRHLIKINYFKRFCTC